MNGHGFIYSVNDRRVCYKCRGVFDGNWVGHNETREIWFCGVQCHGYCCPRCPGVVKCPYPARHGELDLGMNPVPEDFDKPAPRTQVTYIGFYERT